MVTTFCHHNQAKIEVSDALSTLHQHELPEPSVVIVRRYTNTPNMPWGTSCFLYLDISSLSLGVLPLPNSHWTGNVYADYSLSLRLRWSHFLKRGRWGWKCTPIPKRFCRKVQKRNTTCLTWFHCWSLHPLSFPIKNRVLIWRKNWAITQPSGNWRFQSSKDSTGMQVWSRGTGIGLKIWQL